MEKYTCNICGSSLGYIAADFGCSNPNCPQVNPFVINKMRQANLRGMAIGWIVGVVIGIIISLLAFNHGFERAKTAISSWPEITN
jgi:hypothetical protein